MEPSLCALRRAHARGMRGCDNVDRKSTGRQLTQDFKDGISPRDGMPPWDARVLCPSSNGPSSVWGPSRKRRGRSFSGSAGRSSPGAGACATSGGRRHRFFRGRHDSRGRRAAIARERRNERPRHGNDTETPRTPARPPRRRSAPSGESRRSRRRRVGGDDPRRWSGAQSPVALTPPLMRRREGNSAGAHFQSPETARPPSLPRRLPNPENRVWGWTSYFAGV